MLKIYYLTFDDFRIKTGPLKCFTGSADGSIANIMYTIDMVNSLCHVFIPAANSMSTDVIAHPWFVGAQQVESVV